MSISLHAATKEDAVKAGSIYNFTKFVVWPSDVNAREQFNLCVFGDEKFSRGLQAINGKPVAGKPLVLRRNVKENNINICHMAFIANDGSTNIEHILNKTKELPILTVSDSPNFIHKGGMIGLIKDGVHVAFEINVETAKAAGIHIGAQLLKLAKTVRGLK